tara:strand:- start:414 stop:689 length:276 start_codon:yes stop_codon:yes gene_type:complete
MRENDLRILIRRHLLKEMGRDDEKRVRDLVRIELAKLYRDEYSAKIDDQFDKRSKDKKYQEIIYDLIRKFQRKHHQMMHQDYRYYLDKVKP